MNKCRVLVFGGPPDNRDLKKQIEVSADHMSTALISAQFLAQAFRLGGCGVDIECYPELGKAENPEESVEIKIKDLYCTRCDSFFADWGFPHCPRTGCGHDLISERQFELMGGKRVADENSNAGPFQVFLETEKGQSFEVDLYDGNAGVIVIHSHSVSGRRYFVRKNRGQDPRFVEVTGEYLQSQEQRDKIIKSDFP